MLARQAVILFMGAPGSGKGTQSAWLSAQLGTPCLSMGEILRTAAKRSTPDGFRLRRILASGVLVDDDLVCNVAAAELRRHAGNGGVILDGFPRTVKQAVFLDCQLADLGLPRPTVIHLEISAPGLLARLSARRQCAKCGWVYNLISRPSRRGSRCEIDGGALVERDDDREAVILKRLEEFQAMAQPLFSYYREVDFYRIDADREPEAISSDIVSAAAGQGVCAAASSGVTS